MLPGKAESPLVEALRGEGGTDRMPLNRPPLRTEEIKLIETWIEQGAKAVAGEKPGVPPAKVHWAFVAPTRPGVPEVKREGWARNPIDRFIQARLEEAGIAPSAEADRRTLIRRFSLDLTGLPASPEEVDAFVKDQCRARPSESSTGCLNRRTLASGGVASGWTRRGMRIQTAITSMPRGRSGNIATG